jgi:hypothetical protein
VCKIVKGILHEEVLFYRQHLLCALVRAKVVSLVLSQSNSINLTVVDVNLGNKYTHRIE